MLMWPNSSMSVYKKNVANSSFHLVTYNDCTLKVCILSRYTSVATNLTKVVLLVVSLSSVWEKKHFSFLKLIF